MAKKTDVVAAAAGHVNGKTHNPTGLYYADFCQYDDSIESNKLYFWFDFLYFNYLFYTKKIDFLLIYYSFKNNQNATSSTC